MKEIVFIEQPNELTKKELLAIKGGELDVLSLNCWDYNPYPEDCITLTCPTHDNGCNSFQR